MTRSRREPDRTEGEREARRAVQAIMEAVRGARRKVEVGPEAERAAEFILSADGPDRDTERAVALIKNAGREG